MTSLGTLFYITSNIYKVDPGVIFFLSWPVFWVFIAQNVKRCHDIGKSGWNQFIPFYHITLLFEDSHYGVNEHGVNPKGIGNDDNSDY